MFHVQFFYFFLFNETPHHEIGLCCFIFKWTGPILHLAISKIIFVFVPEQASVSRNEKSRSAGQVGQNSTSKNTQTEPEEHQNLHGGQQSREFLQTP